MTYIIHSAEYKMAAITEFQSSQITIQDFAKEKDINFSTKAEETKPQKQSLNTLEP